MAKSDPDIWFHYRPWRKWGRRRQDVIFWPVRWQGWTVILLLPAGILLWSLAVAFLPWLTPGLGIFVAFIAVPIAVIAGVMHAEEVEFPNRHPGDLRDG